MSFLSPFVFVIPALYGAGYLWHILVVYQVLHSFVLLCHTYAYVCKTYWVFRLNLITHLCTPRGMGDKPKKVPVTIRFDPELLLLLKQEAERRGESLSNYIRSSSVMRLSGELVPAQKDSTREAYLRSKGLR